MIRSQSKRTFKALIRFVALLFLFVTCSVPIVHTCCANSTLGHNGSLCCVKKGGHTTLPEMATYSLTLCPTGMLLQTMYSAKASAFLLPENDSGFSCLLSLLLAENSTPNHAASPRQVRAPPHSL